MLTCPSQPRPTPSNVIFTSRYQKNCSSRFFHYFLSLTPVLICKYWLLKVQMLITQSYDIPPGSPRMHRLWWLGLLRQERFLINSPRCRDLQLRLRKSCPGAESNRLQTCNETLVPLRGEFSTIYTNQQFRKTNLCFVCYYQSVQV